MCWSWQVSLCFSLFQWIGISYLTYRNKFMDRWLAAMQIPVAAQESLQFLLWFCAIDDNTTKSHCSPFNYYLSYGLLFVVMIIPTFYFFVFTYKSADFIDFHSICNNNRCSNWRQKIMFSMFIINFIVYGIYVCSLFIYDTYFEGPNCTYVGINGHQEWGWLPMNIEGVPWWMVNFVALVYMSMAVIPIFTYRPLWLFALPVLYGLITAIVTILVTSSDGTLLLFTSLQISESGEWASVWCWAESGFMIWFIFTAILAPKILRIYPDEEALNSSFAKILFAGTHILYKKQQNIVKQKLRQQ